LLTTGFTTPSQRRSSRPYGKKSEEACSQGNRYISWIFATDRSTQHPHEEECDFDCDGQGQDDKSARVFAQLTRTGVGVEKVPQQNGSSSASMASPGFLFPFD